MSSSNLSTLKLNDAVLLGKAIGVVLYIGPVHWIEDKTKIYVGLELAAKIPNGHNGTYDNETYFICKSEQGILLPINSIIRIIKPIELLHKLTEVKKTLVMETNKNKIKMKNNNNINTDQQLTQVQINGILLHEMKEKNAYEIQLKDNKNNVGLHSITLPKQYVKIMQKDDDNVSANNVAENKELEIKPLILKPTKDNNIKKNENKYRQNSNVRRSSISGRKYSVTTRQNGMYDYWRKFIATGIGDDSDKTSFDFMLNNGYILECDGLTNCESIKRIEFVMEYYDEWVFRKSNNFNMSDVDRMIDFLDNLESYNIIKLFNDYCHLIDFHVDNILQPMENNKELFHCTRMDCVCLMRHYKDLCTKNKSYSQKKKLYFIDEDDTDDFDYYFSQKSKKQNFAIDENELKKEKQTVKGKEVSQEIILQEILDKIHCFLCHNLKYDFVNNKNERITFYNNNNNFIDVKQCFDDKLQEIVFKIVNKIPEWKRIKNMRPAMKDLLFDKFTTHLLISDETKELKEEEEESGTGVNIQIGTNFVYEFIQAKYNNLKNEILSREKRYHLAVFSWNDIYDKSLIIKQCYKTRRMGEKRRDSFIKTTAYKYKTRNINVNKDESVSIEFIICLILYCNYIQIRNEFVSTYRKYNKHNSINIEKQHSVFANFGEILKDNINIFGEEWDWNNNKKYLYHCIESNKSNNSNMLLNNNNNNSNYNLTFCGPTSMTNSLLTMILFETKSLTSKMRIGKYDRFVFCINGEYDRGILSGKYNNLKFINCSFIDEYEFENELLFMNDGQMMFYITTIINIINGENYVLYLNAFKLFDFVFMDNNKQNEVRYGLLFDNIKKQQLFSADNQQILEKLLTNDKNDNISANIKQLFRKICQSKKNIKINNDSFINLNENIQKIFSIDKESILINKLLKICPKLIKIHSDAIYLNDENVEKILQLFELNIQTNQLNEINIVLNNNQSPNIGKILNKYRELQHSKWSLNIDGDTLKLKKH